ncbi:hypothetical protein KOY48_05105 [Candidatus Minimicrobia naudis]|uniref:Uncharacterized protein n=1 Tax=Candidatus Minimicrobia naudis TaxID=2841263 RepID=A0A8F1SBN1_9BACT|nr:hypothetical protein KOY48_05105 [Candidatus Minimicrobia naudis]
MLMELSVVAAVLPVGCCVFCDEDPRELIDFFTVEFYWQLDLEMSFVEDGEEVRLWCFVVVDVSASD